MATYTQATMIISGSSEAVEAANLLINVFPHTKELKDYCSLIHTGANDHAQFTINSTGWKKGNKRNTNHLLAMKELGIAIHAANLGYCEMYILEHGEQVPVLWKFVISVEEVNQVSKLVSGWSKPNQITAPLDRGWHHVRID